MTAAVRQPTFVELFTPKLVTVLREGYRFADLKADARRRPDRRDRRAAAVDGDRHRLRRDAGPRALHRDRRRLHRLGARRQPLPDRRPGRRLHRAGGRDRRSSTASTACCSRRCCPGVILLAIGLPAARHLHQVHSLSGDGRLHRRHRRHHLRQPAQGAARPDAGRRGARAVHPEARRRSAAALPTVNPAAVAVGAADDRRSSSPCAASGRTGRPS